jgi:transcriptional regulator with XRE-family HTH domain
MAAAARGITLPQRKRTRSPKAADAVDIAVGQNIRMQRLLHGLSQTELGERLGVTFQQVQKYERGFNRVGSGRLYRIAEIFDMPVAALFAGVGSASARRPAAPAAAIPDREPLRLVRAFERVKDDRARRLIIALVEKLAAE